MLGTELYSYRRMLEVTLPVDRRARMDQRERADRIEPALAAEPIENTEASEPADATDRIDPAEPIDRIEPAEPPTESSRSIRWMRALTQLPFVRAVCSTAARPPRPFGGRCRTPRRTAPA